MSRSKPQSVVLFERISLALQDSPYVPSRRVSIETNAGHVRLKGQVDSFFQKQMAQEILRRIDGVERIENLLEVNWA
jgi:osmotically-inducible protein OsmY